MAGVRCALELCRVDATLATIIRDRNARPIRRLVSSAATLHVALALFALHSIDIRDRGTVAAGVLGAFALGADAATTRVESGQGVDAFAATRTSEDVTALVPRAGTHGRS